MTCPLCNAKCKEVVNGEIVELGNDKFTLKYECPECGEKYYT